MSPKQRKRYFAKEDAWFIPGTELKLLADLGHLGGIFVGKRLSQDLKLDTKKIGKVYRDEQRLDWDDVKVVEE